MGAAENLDQTLLLLAERIKALEASGGSALPIIPIWAEENAVLSANATEWAFGNGANTPAGQGIPMLFRCRLIGLSCSLRNGSATIAVLRNGATADSIAATPGGVFKDISGGAIYDPGDVVGFRTLSASGTGGPNQICAWLQKEPI